MSMDYISLLQSKTPLPGSDKSDKSIFTPIFGSDKSDRTPFGTFVTCPKAQKNSLFEKEQETEGGTESENSDEKPETSWGWWIEFPDRYQVTAHYSPEVSIEQVRRDYPDAVSIAPHELPIQSPAAPMTAEEETAIRAWLAHIEETDPEIVGGVLRQCRDDEAARAYFVGQAMGA
jgi:hypothetical protein